LKNSVFNEVNAWRRESQGNYVKFHDNQGSA
jgi:hypothetical protein